MLGVVINAVRWKLAKPAVSFVLAVELDFAADRRSLEGDYILVLSGVNL